MRYQDHSVVSRGTARGAAVVDQGLRSYLIRVYQYMTMALAVTGVVAYFVGTTPEIYMPLFSNPLLTLLAMLGPLGIVIGISWGGERMEPSTVQALFWVYSALMGISMASIFLAYAGMTVARVFFITAGAFGALSLYGYTTKRDLTAMGGFLMMALFGLMIALFVNIFLKSSSLDLGLSVVGVLLFAGLTAYDTQNLKDQYYLAGANPRTAIYGALRLYLDFVNMFMFLLRLMGGRRD